MKVPVMCGSCHKMKEYDEVPCLSCERDNLIELSKKSMWSMGKTEQEIEAMVDESIAEREK